MFEQRDFVLMRTGGAALLFPQDEVVAVETLKEVRWGECDSPALGLLALNGQALPVYAVTDDIKLAVQPQDGWRFCLCLAVPDKSEQIALACRNVERYRLPDEPVLLQIPAFMRTVDSPLRGLVRLGDELGMVCTMRSMQDLLEASEQRYG